jgi:hypothetical protein
VPQPRRLGKDNGAACDVRQVKEDRPMGELRADERWEAALIENALGGVVQGHDDGSRNSMYDLKLLRPGHPLAAVEETAAADGAFIELWNLVNGSGERWIDPALHGGWLLTLHPTTRAKRLRSEAPSFLRDLEIHGVTEVVVPEVVVPDSLDGASADVTRARALGIVRATSGSTAFPGAIYLTVEIPHERRSSFVEASGDTTAAWVGTFLSNPRQADVLSKLRDAGTAERHAFSFIPAFSVAPHGVTDLLMREDAAPPSRAPTLPKAVTHVWLVGTFGVGRGLRWAPSEGWCYFPKIYTVNDRA